MKTLLILLSILKMLSILKIQLDNTLKGFLKNQKNFL
jgi:hypothetical protein